MITKSLISLLSLALLASGCATLPPEVVQNADYGTCPSDYETQVKNLMGQSLKDPESARYRFGTPYKAYAVDGLLGGSKRYFGYEVEVGVNAKNSYGGYAGESLYKFFMHDGTIQLLDSLSEGRVTKAGF